MAEASVVGSPSVPLDSTVAQKRNHHHVIPFWNSPLTPQLSRPCLVALRVVKVFWCCLYGQRCMAKLMQMNEHSRESSEGQYISTFSLRSLSLWSWYFQRQRTYLLTDPILDPYSTVIFIGKEHYVFHASELQPRNNSLTTRK